MNKLPIVGKEIIIKDALRNTVELHGLMEVRCPKCGHKIITFMKCVHNAHTIVCEECGHVYKKHFPSIALQKKVLQNEVSYFKGKVQ